MIRREDDRKIDRKLKNYSVIDPLTMLQNFQKSLLFHNSRWIELN